MISTARDARFWDRASEKYARSTIKDQAGYERTLERTRELLPAHASVLELGCGTGTTALRLAESVQRYLATDIAPAMIAIAQQKHEANPLPSLAFQVATAETLADEAEVFDAVLGFNYLHLVHDLPATLRAVHGLLAPGGLFISKTACLGDMNPLIRLLLLPVMRVAGLAPTVVVFDAAGLEREIRAAGFEIVLRESHASKGKDTRPFIVARRK
ncbi:bifunctional 2-polyprenyl-6-hydroxyphenol methylase/3-demethylubiquinol 3-O-methyltransferase UbiG [Chelativorans sp. ZYF759]|uniref:class I SAM-dependent methyltransferase n=1 Tax=Chelativorans sp. ZYF759 TaxID=2692213 RepID=UPI001AEE0EB4|nr:class I SAM-dependent methyltransferase [Chelativorans sp. ZYF759]